MHRCVSTVEDDVVWGSVRSGVHRAGSVRLLRDDGARARHPGDWSSFRVGLVDALTVAWGLDTVWLDLDRPAQLERIARAAPGAFGIVDQVRPP
jgi:hypothetical protein